jgi:hypothetical protein
MHHVGIAVTFSDELPGVDLDRRKSHFDVE